MIAKRHFRQQIDRTKKQFGNQLSSEGRNDNNTKTCFCLLILAGWPSSSCAITRFLPVIATKQNRTFMHGNTV